MKNISHPFTKDFAEECFTYHEDGSLIWKARPRGHFKSDNGFTYQNRHFAGNRVKAGRINGYLVVNIHVVGKQLHAGAHRIVWLLHHGYWPVEIDHRNGIRSDNRIENLREVSRGQNCQKKTAVTTGKSGFRGVIKRSSGLFRARIKKDQKWIELGQFTSAREAAEEYDRAAVNLFGEDALTNEAMGLFSLSSGDQLMQSDEGRS